MGYTIRVYTHVGIFDSALWTVATLPFFSTSPCIHNYTYTVCKWEGGYRVLGLRQINTCRKIPSQVNFLDDDILRCLLWVLSFSNGNLRTFQIQNDLTQTSLIWCWRHRKKDTSAGILEQSVGARNPSRNRVFVPARQCLHRLAESIHWNRFLGSINVSKYRLCSKPSPTAALRVLDCSRFQLTRQRGIKQALTHSFIQSFIHSFIQRTVLQRETEFRSYVLTRSQKQVRKESC